MNKTLLLGATALRTVAAGGLALALTAPAYAQDAPAPADQTAPVAPADEQAPAVAASEVELQSDTTASSGEELIVTGSRIRRPNLESTVPITSIGGEAVLPAGRHQHRRHAERAAAAAQHLRPAEPGPRHRHRRPQPARSSRPRHAAHPGAGQRPPPRRRRHPEQRRFARRQHHPERPDRARRHRDRRQLGHLRFGRHRGRRQLRPAPRLRGLQVRGHAGIAGEGFGGNQYVSAMFGKNFGDGRGNITLHGEYAQPGPRLRLGHSVAASGQRPRRRSTSMPARPRRTAATASRTASSSATSAAPDQPLRPDPDHAATGGNPACGTGMRPRHRRDRQPSATRL